MPILALARARPADGADEQSHAVILLGEGMLDTGAGSGACPVAVLLPSAWCLPATRVDPVAGIQKTMELPEGAPWAPALRPTRAVQCLGRRFAKHLQRNNRVQPLQRVARHSIFSRAEQNRVDKNVD
ncbi:hypothetical protein [Mesorhizobium sp. M1405]|uniref:hypothetical protein n=1 Tax=unclassified Mesorhizobium TaxID=325217 RepID=UPI003339BD26